MSKNVQRGCSSPRTQKPRRLYHIIHILTPPMSRIIHALTLLRGHMYIQVHMGEVAILTSIPLRKISTYSMVITPMHITTPKPSVRTPSYFFSDPLRSGSYRDVFFSNISSKAEGHIQISTELCL